jgi:hypothetical protein
LGEGDGDANLLREDVPASRRVRLHTQIPRVASTVSLVGGECIAPRSSRLSDERFGTAPSRPEGKNPALSFRAPSRCTDRTQRGTRRCCTTALTRRNFRKRDEEKFADTSVQLPSSSAAGASSRPPTTSASRGRAACWVTRPRLAPRGHELPLQCETRRLVAQLGDAHAVAQSRQRVAHVRALLLREEGAVCRQCRK